MPSDRWQLVHSKNLCKDDFVEARLHDYELPDGSRMENFLVLFERDGVHVVAITPDDEVLLVQQYRAGVDGFTLECPAGFLEDGEDPLERAQHELREETGYEAETWHLLGMLNPMPHRAHKTDHVFLAVGARRQTGQELDETEFVRWRRVPMAQIEQMILGGSITSSTVIALFYLVRSFLEQRAG